jgi:hypothetical protein
MDEASKVFEGEVRRIARQLWPSPLGSGAALIDGRERDGVFETTEQINIVEATVSRRKDKIEYDFKKTAKAVSDLRRKTPSKFVRGWIVTQEEPTADQRGVATNHVGKAELLSFAQFRAKLVDAEQYLDLRSKYRFGSIESLLPASAAPTREEYIPLGLVDLNSEEVFNPQQLVDLLYSNSARMVLTGEFGAGKSMTMRFIFDRFVESSRQGGSAKFPILLNLRDHFGQRDPVEALERHARSLGFPEPSQLVRAWRAGLATIMLDGFDEVASVGWAGANRRLRAIRNSNMTLVREFVRQTPSEVGIVICGRSQYFDSPAEMEAALGTEHGFMTLSLTEFTEGQIKEYLTRRGITSSIPDWLPSRPLLIGYLASLGVLKSLVNVGQALAPADGWDKLLTLIATREAQIEVDIDGATVRRIIERLATKARKDVSGLGPLSSEDIASAFREITQSSPDERAQVLLLRLPGLGAPTADEGSRTFLDFDFADAARAGDVALYASDPFSFPTEPLKNLYAGMGPLGVGVAELTIGKRGLRQGNIATALLRTSGNSELANLAVDLTNILSARGWSVPDKAIVIEDAYASYLKMDSPESDLSSIVLQNSLISVLALPSEGQLPKCARFAGCLIEVIEGRQGMADLPKDRFDDRCDVSSFSDSNSTTDKIMELHLSEGVRVLLTVLKKLFRQPGSGRRANALHRGLDARARRLVPEILGLIQAEGLAVEVKMGGHSVWLPTRSESTRVNRLLSAPATSTDELIRSCNALK